MIASFVIFVRNWNTRGNDCLWPTAESGERRVSTRCCRSYFPNAVIQELIFHGQFVLLQHFKVGFKFQQGIRQ